MIGAHFMITSSMLVRANSARRSDITASAKNIRTTVSTGQDDVGGHDQDTARKMIQVAAESSRDFLNPSQRDVQNFSQAQANSNSSFSESSSSSPPPPSSSSLSLSAKNESFQATSLSKTLPQERSNKHTRSRPLPRIQCQEFYDVSAKIILLGDYGVGKTSLLKTLSSSQDEDGCGRCRYYNCREMAELVFRRDDKRVMARVMDTGGQEKFRSITSSYYRGVHGCLLVFDVTQAESFDNIMNWYEDLNKYSTDQFVTAILVGTTPPAGNRAVSSERGLKMADSLGIEYIECASDDEVTVSAVVRRLIDAIIKAGLHRNSVTIEIKPRGIQSANSMHRSDSMQMECFC